VVWAAGYWQPIRSHDAKRRRRPTGEPDQESMERKQENKIEQAGILGIFLPVPAGIDSTAGSSHHIYDFHAFDFDLAQRASLPIAISLSPSKSMSWNTHMRVGDFMTARVVTVQPDSPVAEAAQLMLDKNVSGLPVIDAAGNIVGIVTEHDLLRRLANGPRSTPPHWLQFMIKRQEMANESARFHEAKVAEVMTCNPLTITEGAPIEDACRLIEKHGFKRLPVVRDGRLVGIVARADLVRALGLAVPQISHAHERAERAEATMAELQRESILHRTRWPM
jgi:CBS domain-containing protein